jgi:hypothetical protein
MTAAITATDRVFMIFLTSIPNVAARHDRGRSGYLIRSGSREDVNCRKFARDRIARLHRLQARAELLGDQISKAQ